jgi:hypothetical protein
MSLTVRYRPDQLPALMPWRMLGVRTYVMAMEPANCPTIEGRTAAREMRDATFLRKARGANTTWSLTCELFSGILP